MDGGMQQEMIQQQQMQLMMLDETMNGPQAVRYDEVYYPRTDKRSISKLQTNLNSTELAFQTECNASFLFDLQYRGKPVHIQRKRIQFENSKCKCCLGHCKQCYWQPGDRQESY